jgi:predicted nucleic acid-binding Zn ribbon protein
MKKASELIEQVFLSIDSLQPEEKKYVSIFRSWEKIAGTDIASHSVVKEIESKTLIIEVDHPSWSQLLTIQKKSILRKIQNMFPELEILRIRIVLS